MMLSALLGALLWAPPALHAPKVVTLGSGFTVSKLDPTRDYVIKLPPGIKSGSTALMGGHNITIIGGHVTVPPGDKMRRALYIKGATGTVHIEGVLIDNPKGAEFDGIAIAAPQAIVQIQNVRIEGITGWQRSWHADLIQPWGGVKELRVDHFTGISAYQGVQFSGLKGPVGAVTLSHVNMRSDGAQVWLKGAKGGNGGYLLWYGCRQAFPLKLDTVFVQPRSERGPALAAYPPANDSTACPSRLTSDGKSMSFPKLPIQGELTIGVPPGGDYVSAASVGQNYSSKNF